MSYETPYERHAKLAGHKMTRHSPNGVDIIEECTYRHCGARFLHNPCIGYPVSLDPLTARPTLAEWSERHGIPIKVTPAVSGRAGCKYAIMDSLNTGKGGLYHLSDYRVSSVSGPVVYLVPVSYVHEGEKAGE